MNLHSLLAPFVTVIWAIVVALPAIATEPLALHPENPHYFLFHGKPTVLITSGEHYGAVLNREFDFSKYLDELQAHGLNLTRTFAGVYCEDNKSFGIARNTLAPAEGDLICPWARSEQPGYAGGGNKFDLDKWDDAYFDRLRKFMTEAGRRGVVVELDFFCPFYDDSMWRLSPMNAANNVNEVGTVARTDVYTLDKHGGLLDVQERLVRKLVAELAEFDNLYFEICNEPYFGGVTMDWQRRIADTVVSAEADRPHKHLISMNVANGSAKVSDPHPAVSIFNFHYTTPPTAVAENFALNKVVGCNETGFKGTADEYYRREAWAFMLAGGGLFNHLDYSFTVGHEDGTFEYPPSQPGGGTRTLRKQFRTLAEFLSSFDFIRMKPDASIIRTKLPDGATAQALVEPGKQYAIYLFDGKLESLAVELPKGRVQWRWLNPVSGKFSESATLDHPGGAANFPATQFAPDAALSIRSE